MKPHFLATLLLFGISQFVSAFDTEKASTGRFKVAYVEPAVIQPITELPKSYPGRESFIKSYQAAVKNGASEKDQILSRKQAFQYALYPIRVTDKDTGNTYELQSDRRTIVAKKLNGELIWTINPFIDAKLKAYRVNHPIIHYFGKSNNYSNLKGAVLGISFTSSQFGDIELESGKFHWQGQD